jgi:hypothetical protein
MRRNEMYVVLGKYRNLCNLFDSREAAEWYVEYQNACNEEAGIRNMPYTIEIWGIYDLKIAKEVWPR